MTQNETFEPGQLLHSILIKYSTDECTIHNCYTIKFETVK